MPELYRATWHQEAIQEQSKDHMASDHTQWQVITRKTNGTISRRGSGDLKR